LGPIGSAVLTFIGYKQTDKQTDKPNLYIDRTYPLENIRIVKYIELIPWKNIRIDKYIELILWKISG